MKVDVMPDGTIRLKQLYNSIVLETDDGQRMAVCFRDSGIEFGVSESYHKDDYVWFQAEKGKVSREGKQVPNIVRSNPDAPDSDFMVLLDMGKHLRDLGLSEEAIQKVKAISQKYQFKGEQNDKS